MADNFDFQAALKDAVSPLDVATQKRLEIQAEQRRQQAGLQSMAAENQFVTARNAQSIAQEGQLRSQLSTQEAAQHSAESTQINKEAIARAQADADIARDAGIRTKAQSLYKLPTTDEDGNKIPADELVQNMADAAGTQAKNFQQQIFANNAKLMSIGPVMPDVNAAAKQAARNIISNPVLTSQIDPKILSQVESLVAAQESNPTGLSNLIYNKEHGIGSWLESLLPGPSGHYQATIIQSALEKEMDNQIAAQTNFKTQQSMFQMKAIAQQNEVLQGKYEQYFQDASPEVQAKLLSPTSLTNAATGGISGRSDDPSKFVPSKVAPTTPNQSPTAAPDSAGNGALNLAPPSATTSYFKNLSDADNEIQHAQTLADRLSDLTGQRAKVHSQITGGYPAPYTIPGVSSGAPVSVSTTVPLTNAQKAALSQQDDDLGAQIQQVKAAYDQATQNANMSRVKAFGVPTQPAPTPPVNGALNLAQPTNAPAVSPGTPPGQPTTAAPSPQVISTMHQLANADGINSDQFIQIAQQATQGNQQAAMLMKQYHDRAASVSGGQDNPFAATQIPYMAS